MQEERPHVCIKCGHENPGNYCPNCGARQHRDQRTNGSVSWKTVFVAAAIAIPAAIAILVIIDATGPPPIHEKVTCREIADHWTAQEDNILRITRIGTGFRGQDRMECRGQADIEQGRDKWAELGARRDHEGNIHYFLEWE